MWIRRAPASSAFSSSSFTTEAGRSTTSPAAILLATCSGSTWILPMQVVAPGMKADEGRLNQKVKKQKRWGGTGQQAGYQNRKNAFERCLAQISRPRSQG